MKAIKLFSRILFPIVYLEEKRYRKNPMIEERTDSTMTSDIRISTIDSMICISYPPLWIIVCFNYDAVIRTTRLIKRVSIFSLLKILSSHDRVNYQINPHTEIMDLLYCRIRKNNYRKSNTFEKFYCREDEYCQVTVQMLQLALKKGELL